MDRVNRSESTELSAAELLRAALGVERFIASCKLSGEQGRLWQRTPEPKSGAPRTFYHGSAGIALFYLELHQATQEARYLQEAVSAGEELIAYAEHKSFLTIGFYSGWPGLVFVLNELFKASGDARFKTGARLCLEKMRAQASDIGAGIGWVEPMPCLLYTSPSPRDRTRSRMPSSA